MLANYFAAAIRNLFRNRAYAAINLLGLSVGFAAAILIALYVRDEYSYDRFFPDADRIYQVTELIEPPGGVPLRISVTASDIAPAMQLNFPKIDVATRIVRMGAMLRHGEKEAASATAFWAEPNFFHLFPMKAHAGDLERALNEPSSIVLTRKAARRFFGRDDVVGESIELDREHVMRVSAVMEDWPSQSNFYCEVLLPAVASFSPLSMLDALGTDMFKGENVYSFVRLRRGADIERLRSGLRNFADQHVPGEINRVRNAKFYTFFLTPISQVHFLPSSTGEMKPPADPRIVHAMVGIAFLILVVAGGNFVSMMTARAAGRAIEVGVRKAVGATRRQIMAQFMGECLLYTAWAMLMAIVAVTLLLPAFNGFLQREIVFDYMSDAKLGIGLLSLWVIVGMTAGAYPALVLSQFRPSAVLKGTAGAPQGRGRIRHALVVFQFGTLIALLVAALTIHRQTQFALEERLHLPTDQIYIGGAGFACPQEFADAAKQLTGVRAVSCVSNVALNFSRMSALFFAPNGGLIANRAAPVDYAFFDVFNIRPLAGRLLSADYGEDDVLSGGSETPANPSLVINESAARALGFSSPSAAVGQFRSWRRLKIVGYKVEPMDTASSKIVGVIPDFSIGSVRDVIEPTVYYVDPAMFHFVVLKIDGQAIPDTVRQLGALWARQDSLHPFGGTFLDQYINALYLDIMRQSTIFAVFAGVAIVIAALGLLGLAIFTAERRTKEIGLRKVMGASRLDILRFLGWQFTRPVLWANLLAWPCAYLVMRRWLEGFAYHVDLSFLTFLLASALAVVIALATVAAHALIVARARPVEALRYE